MASVTGKAKIVWFRKGLRLHDNPALIEACRGAAHVYPIFILDPHFRSAGYKVGVNRFKFLMQSLTDLNDSFEARGSRLLVLRGKPEDVLPQVFKDWQVDELCYEVDTEPYAVLRDAHVSSLAKAANVEVKSFVSHTLYDTADIVERNGGKPPLTYQSFIKLVDKMGDPTAPAPDPPEKMPPPRDDLPGAAPQETSVPTLKEIGYDQEPTAPFKGGEREALARMDTYLSDKLWVANFEKPQTDPSAFEKPATTTLSPYLKFGCLSPRLFHTRLLQIYKEQKKHSEPPVSLRGQLLWREFFYTVGAHTPNFSHMVGNTVCRQIDWRHQDAATADSEAEQHLAAWKAGRTGFPWIDAIMTQLHEWGWIHHLARHSVACFLTRGDLYISWERGQEVFEELLLDQDHFINAGNWMWLSASAFFSQYFRVYSPVVFGKKYDPEGKYIRKFLPVLKDMPAKYIYEPWLAPTEVQKKAKCIIGVDYPRPIVDHSIASKQNIGRMAAAYKANKGEGEGEAADTPKKAAKPRKAAAPKAAKKEATDVVSGKGAKRQRTMKEFASKKETE
uniref:6-4 photolyase n=1 Tax=Chlamydomonas sp. ICE-L TaxID=309537 RepID=A0A2Z5J5J9_9CHLO|nr:6-4 photolyase [Chlamydomonas sp. ICE-L]